MHVMLVSSSFATPEIPRLGGGSAAVAQAVARTLVAFGHRVSVLRAEPVDRAPETVDGIEVYSVAKRNIYHWQEETRAGPIAKVAWHALEDNGPLHRRTAEIVASCRPDIIATHNILGIGRRIWHVAEAQGIPAVHTLHDYYLSCPRTTRYKTDTACRTTCDSCRILTFGRRAATASLTGVISVSRHVLDVHLQDGLFAATPDRRVIPNAPDVPVEITPSNYDGMRPFRIGFLGRGTRPKGLGVLAQAFDRMRWTNSRLVIAGDVQPELEPDLDRMVRRAAVERLGHADRAQFFRSIDLLVVPSLHAEPFSLVVAEALAHGRPVVASRTGGIPEALGGEDAGWLMPPGDPRLLADLLDRLAESPKELQARGKAGRTRACDWTERDNGTAYEQAYLSAIERFALRNRA